MHGNAVENVENPLCSAGRVKHIRQKKWTGLTRKAYLIYQRTRGTHGSMMPAPAVPTSSTPAPAVEEGSCWISAGNRHATTY